jgi:hypothetical protein
VKGGWKRGVHEGGDMGGAGGLNRQLQVKVQEGLGVWEVQEGGVRWACRRGLESGKGQEV